MGTVVIATIVSSWFDRRRGLAISFAFNGATCGGIIIAPMLVVLVGAFGFARAMLTMTAVMIFVLVPVVIGLVGISTGKPGRSGQAGAPALSRSKLLRHFGFWTITAPFALALLAQVGFIVHQIALLEPTMGRALAALAVAVTTTNGRDRTALPRTGSSTGSIPAWRAAVSLVTQAGAVSAIAQTTDTAVLFIWPAPFTGFPSAISSRCRH